MLRLIFLTIFISLTTIVHADGREYLIPKVSNSSCNFYEKIGGQLNCELNSDYCIQYGFKYCSKFQDLKKSGIGDLTKWVPKVTICLQRELSDPQVYDENSSPVTSSVCEKVRFRAFHSHPECYVNSGFCELTASSKQAAFNVVAWADMLSNLNYSLAQALVVGEVCKVKIDEAWVMFVKFLFAQTRDVRDDVKELAANVVLDTPVDQAERKKYAVFYLDELNTSDFEHQPVASDDDESSNLGFFERLFGSIFGQTKYKKQAAHISNEYLLKLRLRGARSKWKNKFEKK